jgi:hypothetical protein
MRPHALLRSILATALVACVPPDLGAGGSPTSASVGGGPAAASTTLQSSASGQTSGTGGSAGAGGAPAAPAPAPTDGPQLLSFTADAGQLTAGATVTFTAKLADPDGVGDVAGGSLTDELGAAYGAFLGTAQPGTYQLSISWAQIDQGHPIVLPRGATVTRTFTARFFDLESHGTQRSLMLTLTCHGLAACNGACVDPAQSPDVCSTCDPPCADGAACYLGQCAALTACAGKMTSCQLACAAAGMTCANQCQGGRGGVAYTHAACGGDPHPVLCGDPIFAYEASACCCF